MFYYFNHGKNNSAAHLEVENKNGKPRRTTCEPDANVTPAGREAEEERLDAAADEDSSEQRVSPEHVARRGAAERVSLRLE